VPPFSSLKSTFGHTLGASARARARDVELVRRERLHSRHARLLAARAPESTLTPQLEPTAMARGQDAAPVQRVRLRRNVSVLRRGGHAMSWGHQGSRLAELFGPHTRRSARADEPCSPSMWVAFRARRSTARISEPHRQALSPNGALHSARAVGRARSGASQRAARWPAKSTGVFLATGLGNLSDMVPFSHAIFGEPGLSR